MYLEKMDIFSNMTSTWEMAILLLNGKPMLINSSYSNGCLESNVFMVHQTFLLKQQAKLIHAFYYLFKVINGSWKH